MGIRRIMRHRLYARLVAWSMVSMWLVACTPSGQDVPVESLVWPEGDSVYYVRLPVSDGLGSLWRRERDGKEHLVELPGMPGCERSEIRFVFPLASSRFGMSQLCGSYDYALAEFDPRAGVAEMVARLGGQPGLEARWSDDRAHAFVAVCDVVAGVDLTGAPLVGPLGPVADTADCDRSRARVADANFVDGYAAVVYLYSADVLDGSGGYNYASTWSILRAAAPTGVRATAAATVVWSGIVDARALAVSPVGSAMVFCGSFRGENGLWKAGPGVLPVMVSQGVCTGAAISPDGTAVAFIRAGEVRFADLVPR